MSKNLDLEHWEKQNGLPKTHKCMKWQKNLPDNLPKNIRILAQEAMEGDEITHVMTSPSLKHKTPSVFFILPFLAISAFFTFIIMRMVFSGEQPLLFLFLFLPIFIFSHLWKTVEKRYFIFGKKSFYYVELMDRPIFYEEIKDVALTAIAVKTPAKSSDAVYHHHVLCFSFYEDIYEGISGEAQYFRHKAGDDEILRNPKNLAVYRHRFDYEVLISELSQRIKTNP